MDDHSGVLLGKATLDGLAVSEVRLPPGLRLAAHAHRRAQLCVVLEGSYVEECRGRRTTLGPGSVVVRPAGEPHANAVRDDEEPLALLVSFDADRLAGLAPDQPRFAHVPFFRDLGAGIARELARQGADCLASVEALTLVLGARAACMVAAAPEPPWLADLEDLVAAARGDLSLAALAAHAGVHPVTVSAAFRRHRHASVGEVLRHARVRRAVDLLRKTAMPLGEVAVECGFYDQSHLGRVVKRVAGSTPRQLRRGG
ncbi:MAG TPA: AraC family transcriptional regulator [Vicinamibacteria bacterium]|nr:AraC family transcriptional regulator [Vicinamibacteria bacterium]